MEFGHREALVQVSFDVALSYSSDTETSIVQESIESSSKLFFNNALKESNYVVKGLRGEGTVDLKEITSILDTSPIIDTKRRSKCK